MFLVAQRHALHLLAQRPPIIGLKLGVLDAFLTPILMQPTDMVLARLEEKKLVPDTLFDEDSSRVLLDDRFLVLCFISNQPQTQYDQSCSRA